MTTREILGRASTVSSVGVATASPFSILEWYQAGYYAQRADSAAASMRNTQDTLAFAKEHPEKYVSGRNAYEELQAYVKMQADESAYFADLSQEALVWSEVLGYVALTLAAIALGTYIAKKSLHR
jgi:hypothetical protein